MPDFRPHLDLLLWPAEVEVVASWGRAVTEPSVSSLAGDDVLVCESWPEVLTNTDGDAYAWLHHWRVSPLLPRQFYTVMLAAGAAVDADGNANAAATLQFLLPDSATPSLLPHGASALEAGLEVTGQGLLPRRQALLQRVRRFPDPEAWYFPAFLLPLLYDQGGSELLGLLPPLTAWQEWPELNRRRGTPWSLQHLLGLMFETAPVVTEGVPYRRWWRLEVFIPLAAAVETAERLQSATSAVKLFAPARSQLQRVVTGRQTTSLLVLSDSASQLSNGATWDHAGGIRLSDDDPTFYLQNFMAALVWEADAPELVFSSRGA